MAESGLVVFVPEAEAMVSAWRLRHDPSARLGVAAHLTLLFPFLAPAAIDAPVLDRVARVLAGFAPFDFSLDRVGRFPTTAWLAPAPAEPFIALTEALVREFPEQRPFAGAHEKIVAHLTVAHGDAGEAARIEVALGRALHDAGAIRSRCGSAVLIENRSGRFVTMREFPLGKAAGAAAQNRR